MLLVNPFSSLNHLKTVDDLAYNPPYSAPADDRTIFNMAKIEKKGWKPDDVAVIGLACRFPGSASDEAKLWELLAERKC
jgi:hypothetical protein